LFETDKIRQLVEMMVKNDLVEISLRDGDVEVNLRRPNPSSMPAVQVSHAPLVSTAQPPLTAPPPSGGLPEEAVPSEPDEDMVEIRSPMVGTFYTKPSPDTPTFVSVGSSVGPDTVVCIVEAMKVFNEIKAETTGTIEKILAPNESAVEFGQPLFLVRPT
jgi:acetyl-CoA carboxylase biotin carboxyl carrier protein